MKVKINTERKLPDITKLIESFKKGGKKNWIKGAVNPKHKGFCTPMTKTTCTPRRKAFAMTMKKHHGFHKRAQGGGLETTFDQYKLGGKINFDISSILGKWKK